MKKPWSISTTVRNAERIRNFLLVLRDLENQEWNNESQIRYQILLIQNRYYGLTNQFFNDLSPEQIALLQSADEMSYEQAEEIFNAKGYEDPAMRGRQSLNPLKKLGLAHIVDGRVSITQLGQYLLQEDYDLGEMFFKSFLKWQLPNLDSDDFNDGDGFLIKPFVATLHLIQSVNQKWTALGHTPKGISRDEFSLFVPTLIDYRQINNQAERIITLRNLCLDHTPIEQKSIFERFERQFVIDFLGTSRRDLVESCIQNLGDYGDNTIRYFRLTRYFFIRGGGFYIDLEPRRAIEIEALLTSDNAAPQHFENVDEYRSYISNISLPILPWETLIALRNIARNSLEDIVTIQSQLEGRGIDIPTFEPVDFSQMSEEALKDYIEELRKYRRSLRDAEIHFDAQNILKIAEYIDLLKNIHNSRVKKSIELERLAVLALNALNDAIAIRPNYPVGDDNEPIFTAPANKPDIECFYDAFNVVCEVTMLTSRDQWYNEGQPVMRHVRDFEDKYNEKRAYCLFISPRLHVDTAETFWVAIKHGYKGAQQRIVPLSITQLIEILEVLVTLKRAGKLFSHQDLSMLFDQILTITNATEDSDRWIERIPDTVSVWGESLLAR